MPGFNYDLSHPGRGDSHGWFFFTTYNTEEAHTLQEVNASQNDKDFIAAVNWKKIQEYVANGGGQEMDAEYAHNVYDHGTHTATSTMMNKVLRVDPTRCGRRCIISCLLQNLLTVVTWILPENIL